MKFMAFDDPCKPSPLAEAGDIHNVPGFKKVHGHFLPQLVACRVLDAEFLDRIESSFSCLLKMAGERFVHPLGVLRKEDELKGIVTVRLFRFFLNHGARTYLDDGRRYDGAIFKKVLSHP